MPEPKLPPRDPEPDPLYPGYQRQDPDNTDPDVVPQTDPPVFQPHI